MNMEDEAKARLTLAMNVLRENPRLQYLDDDVVHDKMLNLKLLRLWDRQLDDYERTKAWHKLIWDAQRWLDRDRKRAAWWLKQCDMSVFGDQAAEAYTQLEAHAIAGLLLGAQSDMALSIIASLTGRSKPHCGRWRKRLMNAGYLRGTLGKCRTKTEPGETARIIFPTPEDTPHGFNEDKVLPPLSDEQASLIRLPMDLSRQASLNHAEKLVELSPKGKRAKIRVDRAVAARGHISSRSTNHTINGSLEESGSRPSSGWVGSTHRTESTTQPPSEESEAARQSLIEDMESRLCGWWEIHARLIARGYRGIR